jgi:probable F420-dependent oxidoreductase
MDFGVGYFPTHDAMAPGPLARLVEEHGQGSLFFAEHTHIPASRDSPFPGGGPLPHRYANTLELFVALTAAAGATSRLRVGSGVCLVIQRDPIITAKAVASIDRLSGGRMEFGVGAGWNREEMANHGTDPRRRMAVLRERVEAMRAIWTQHEASYAGEHVSFDRIWCDPKPLQRPYPPILVGGDGPTVLDRVLAYGDVWFPTYRDPDGIFARVDELRARADRRISVQAIGLPPRAQEIERCAAAGLSRVVHWLPSGGRSAVEARLERWEAAITEFTGG